MTSIPITVTKSATTKIFALIQEDGNLNLKLRVSITGGGCSGFQYSFAFDEATLEDDFIIATHDALVNVLIDAVSIQYLKGAEIDYEETIEGEQFIIRNPNAKTTCGCGSSFSIEDAAGE